MVSTKPVWVETPSLALSALLGGVDVLEPSVELVAGPSSSPPCAGQPVASHTTKHEAPRRHGERFGGRKSGDVMPGVSHGFHGPSPC